MNAVALRAQTEDAWVAQLDRLVEVFNRSFTGTCLIGGADEPMYQPTTGARRQHHLYFRQDYFASALHEISHWCIAGSARRQQLDFGYWYAPEGRSQREQADFERVEVGPQAMEWFFAKACAYPFQVSVDNLDPISGELPDTLPFRRRVVAQALHWKRSGLPARAGRFYSALAQEFKRDRSIQGLEFSLAELS